VTKILVFIIILFSSYLGAQNVVIDTIKEKTQTIRKNIIVDRNTTIELKPFDKNFKEKYRSKDFVYVEKPAKKTLWDDFKEWLSRQFGESNSEVSGALIDTIFRIGAFIIILIVVILIVRMIMNKEGRWIFGRNSDKKIIQYSEIEKNIHTTDFEKLIQQTMATGEKRLSIRYYYLWLLKKMSDKEIIVWDIEKTNSDYLYEIKDEIKKEEFKYTSYLYNYIWYGEFDLDDSTFDKAINTFKKAIKSA
jgi:hypothetical protein